jgi:hypothetical protein
MVLECIFAMDIVVCLALGIPTPTYCSQRGGNQASELGTVAAHILFLAGQVTAEWGRDDHLPRPTSMILFPNSDDVIPRP